MGFSAVLLESGSELDRFDDAQAQLNRRRAGRRTLSLSSKAVMPRSGEVPIVVRDISSEGLLLEGAPGTINPGDCITIELPEQGPLSMKVAWASGRFFGCEFAEEVSGAVVSAALLLAQPLAPAGEPIEVVQASQSAESSRVVFAPERNFSVALLLALALWAGIGLAIYAAASLI